MSPEGHPNWGGARPNSGPKPRYSLCRAIAGALERSSLDGLEGEVSAELDAQARDNLLLRGLQYGGKGRSISVPFSAFNTRTVEVSGTGSALFGQPVREELGILRWSAVANSGATHITGLRENLMMTHTGSFPEVRWTLEAGATIDSDPTIIGVASHPFRISTQVGLTRQLSVQTGGGADELIAREIGRALSAAVDAAALYGLGDGIQPRGILHTNGVNNTPIGASGDWWSHLGAMRLACLADDAEFDGYGTIFSPGAEAYFHETTNFPSSGNSILMALPWPHQVTNQINDGRVFTGCWPYEVLLFWGNGVDLVVDRTSRAMEAILIITASIYADTVCRFPSAFAFSEEDSITLPPLMRRRTKPELTVKSAGGGKVDKPAPIQESPFR